MSGCAEILGTPRAGGILVVCDHASNAIPEGVELGIAEEHLNQHIGWDIGVTGVAEYLVSLSDCTAFLAKWSRLLVDLNRYPEEDSVVPRFSDGIAIPGNQIDDVARAKRVQQYFDPYHAELSSLLAHNHPALILSLHSFTPALESDPSAERPWQIGILYNEHETASQLAIGRLEGEGLIVGDQLPYSGKQLNATMNRHAEAHDIPYVGIEIRQDLIADPVGQEHFAAILAEMAQYVVERLASDTAS